MKWLFAVFIVRATASGGTVFNCQNLYSMSCKAFLFSENVTILQSDLFRCFAWFAKRLLILLKCHSSVAVLCIYRWVYHFILLIAVRRSLFKQQSCQVDRETKFRLPVPGEDGDLREHRAIKCITSNREKIFMAVVTSDCIYIWLAHVRCFERLTFML